MGAFKKLIRFKSENGKAYFADLEDHTSAVPASGSQITAYESFQDLQSKSNSDKVVIKEVRKDNAHKLSVDIEMACAKEKKNVMGIASRSAASG